MTKLKTHVENDTDEEHDKSKTPTQEVEMALKECSFGWFNVNLIFASTFTSLTGVFTTNTTPYLLPNAECDLNMNLLQKGVLNAAPFFGMIMSGIPGGFLLDTFGRKWFVVGGYAGIFIFNFISALSQTYEMLVFSKFMEGLLFSTAVTAVMTLNAELCHKGIRDRILLLLASFRALGQVVLALISWAVLTQDWRVTFFDGYFTLNTWNFYLMIISTFPLIGTILYCFQPESPKYLVTHNRLDEARETLKKIYKMNTGKSVESFSYANLWTQKPVSTEMDKDVPKKSFSSQVSSGLHNIKSLLRKPLSSYLILFCFMSFIIMAMFNILRLWFPQLSTIVEHYSGKDKNTELCAMLDAYTSDLRTIAANTTARSEVCVPVRSGQETYINSIILGFICCIPFIIGGVFVRAIGKKILIITASVVATIATLWLRWSSSKVELVALFAVNVATGQLMMNLLQVTAIDIFPTTTVGIVISLMWMIGRIGSLLGNILFPILLDKGCVVPFYTLAGLMSLVMLLTILLPKKKN